MAHEIAYYLQSVVLFTILCMSIAEEFQVIVILENPIVNKVQSCNYETAETLNSECSVNMECKPDGKCSCNEDYPVKNDHTTVFDSCLKGSQLFSSCNISEQCQYYVNDSQCSYYRHCECQQNYFQFKNETMKKPMCLKVSQLSELCNVTMQCEFSDLGSECIQRDGYQRKCYCKSTHSRAYTSLGKSKCIKNVVIANKTKDIYKAAMVALACFMVTIIGLFILFLCNRSFLRRNRRSQDNTASRRTSDVFNISENLAAMRLCDKPPTYDDVVRTDRMIRGVPPPVYNESNNEESSNRIVAPASNPGTSTGSNRFFFFRRETSNHATPSIVIQSSNQQGTLQLQNDIGDVTSTDAGTPNRAFVSDA